jgi:acyl transferase domain-containing protein/acyl carrier protein
VKSHVDPTGKVRNTSLTPYGCFYDGVGNFDITLFKMSPREAAQTDPMQRLMLVTAYEALESSGYYDTGDSDFRPKNGTFYGVAGDDYRQVNSSQDVDINYITGGTRAFGPGRVSYYLGWEGPSMSIDTACSASAVAMHQAIMSLKLRDCDVALSGGANLLTCSDMFAGLSRAKFVNTTGPCKTFDETADGYCRADGFATVVLKRLGDAIRDKDNILGVIRSVETYHAGTAISLTHPEADTQTALFRSVLSTAGMTVDDIDHIELHGTGTQAGDLAESMSVAGLLNRPRHKDRPLTISSVKPNVGHSEAASGVTSLIKGLLMLQHQTIPQHIGIKTRINPKLPAFDELGIVVPRENMFYPALAKDGKRRMLVNNFNATGGITAMLLEEYKASHFNITDTRTHYPMTVSAATVTALRSMLTQLLEYLRVKPEINLSHLSYTLTARRLHHKHRFACVVKSQNELVQRLETELLTPKTRYNEHPFGVFVLTGQTSALPQAKVLFNANTTFRNHIIYSDQLCRDMGVPSFIDVITGDVKECSHVQLQLALVSLEIALAALFQLWGIQPQAVIGHSLGEYAALCICNVLSLADTLWLVGKRGLLIESACKSNEYSMVVVAISAADAAKLLQAFPGCEISCCNSPQQTVLSVMEEDVESLLSHLVSMNIKATKLCTPYGFHSKQMDTILKDYRKVVQNISFRKPTVTFISTLLGEVVRDESKFCAEYLCRQTREPVRFEDALHKLETLVESGQKAFWIELGPTPACLPMIASALQVKPNALVAALDQKKPNWETVSQVSGTYYTNNGSVRWDEYHREYLGCLRLLQLPSYPFDLKWHWIQYDGDWMIRKNQKPVCENTEATPRVRLESSTLHRIENDSTERGVRKLTFATDLASGELKDLLQDTKPSATLTFPGSILVDMAMSAASHICKYSGEAYTTMGVFDLKTLLGNAPSSATSLRTVAKQLPTDTNEIQITITFSESGKNMELARCRIIISDGVDWASEANSNAYLFESRMNLLPFLMANGQSTYLTRSNVHQLVTYDDASLGIEEVLLSISTLEAVGKLNTLPNTSKNVCNPRWTEALMKLAAILLNCSLRSQHICYGWNKMHLLAPLETGKAYRAHVRMQPDGQSGAMVGDVYVLDGTGSAVTVIRQMIFRPDPSNSKAIPNVGDASSTQRVLRMHNSQNIGPSVVSESQGSLDSSPCTLLPEKLISTPQGDAATTCAVTSRKISPKRDISSKPTRTPPVSSGLEELQTSRSPISDGKSRMRFESVIDILAAEIGVESEYLTDDILLQELGVDSIIELSVVARLQEYMSETLPPAFLMKHNSISKLRKFFTGSALSA